jgi:Spy/CpxP family protein refolding chaperone
MRTLSFALTLVLAATAGGRLFARDNKDTERGRLANEMIQDLNLTDEQEAKIAEIRKECKSKVEEAAKDLSGFVKEEMQKIGAILTPEQRQKVQAMRDIRRENRAAGVAQTIAHLDELDLTSAEMAQIAEIRKEFHPKIAQALQGLRGVLTDDQRKEREEALRAGKTRREVFSSLKLNDEQKQKLETVCKEVRSFVHEEMDKIRGVLSEEQQQKLGEFREERKERARDRVAAAVAEYRDLNLTDEQKNQIAEIRKEFRPKIHEAGNKLRGAVRDELNQIVAVLKG